MGDRQVVLDRAEVEACPPCCSLQVGNRRDRLACAVCALRGEEPVIADVDDEWVAVRADGDLRAATRAEVVDRAVLAAGVVAGDDEHRPFSGIRGVRTSLLDEDNGRVALWADRDSRRLCPACNRHRGGPAHRRACGVLTRREGEAELVVGGPREVDGEEPAVGCDGQLDVVAGVHRLAGLEHDRGPQVAGRGGGRGQRGRGCRRHAGGGVGDLVAVGEVSASQPTQAAAPTAIATANAASAAITGRRRGGRTSTVTPSSILRISSTRASTSMRGAVVST